MAVLKCKMCGGDLNIGANQSVGVCEFCGTKQTLPKLDNDRKNNLYDRANHFRRNNEYDKAMAIFENILNEDNTDAESYWSLVLCKYGIEYVKDPVSDKRVPTVNRAQFTSVFADENYKSAIKYADSSQRSIYEEEAKAIDEIQKGILAISQKEKPFDVFICYKETDASGSRTKDSVIANELYHELTKEGFKVFFSRITLEDKLGTAYEPYIFAALNSSKVMVVIGTKPEYFSAVWVKNEWSRYLALIKNGEKKMLIPAYRDMDPYDLPEEFSHLQAQDMSKLGFMQDLIRGIKKITAVDEPAPATVVKETIVQQSGGNATVDSLLKRVFIFLEDKDFSSANEYAEKVLDIDPENAQAYLGKLLVEFRCSNTDNLVSGIDFSNSVNYQKAVRFADENFITQLVEYLNKSLYSIARRYEQAKEYINAVSWYRKVVEYSDSKIRISQCIESQYRYAVELKSNVKSAKDCYEAKREFEKIIEYKDSKTQADECGERAMEFRYVHMLNQMDLASSPNKFIAVASGFDTLGGYKDSLVLANKCREMAVKCKSYNDAFELYTRKSKDLHLRKKEIETIIHLYEKAIGYKDAEEKAETHKKELEDINHSIAGEQIIAEARRKYFEKYSILAEEEKTIQQIDRLEKYLSRVLVKKVSKALFVFIGVAILGVLISIVGLATDIVEILAIGIFIFVVFGIVSMIKIIVNCKRKRSIKAKQRTLAELKQKYDDIKAVPEFDIADFI